MGIWEGTLQAGSRALRLRLEIGADTNAVLTSIDQGNARIPAQVLKADATSIVVDIAAVGARYEAQLTAMPSLDGKFTQAGQSFHLVMQRAVAVTLPSPPEKLGPMSADNLHKLRLQLGTPGVAAGWAQSKIPPTIVSDGLRMVDASVPVQPSDSWHLGSLTKSMTATLAARLVEAGVIRWDNPIGSVLGKLIPDIHPDFVPVTLLHLLSHHSGLAAAAGEAALGDYSVTRANDIGAERIRFARSVISLAPATRPGSSFAYANAGYVTAAAMMEVLTGQTWEELIVRHVFRPLRLSSAGIGLPGHEGRIDQPVSHRIDADGKRLPHYTDLPAIFGPAGLVHMNIADLLTFLAAHRDAPADFLANETWKRLHTPPFGASNDGPYGSSYALGWVVLPSGLMMHTGSNLFWFSIALIDPKSGAIAAYAGNDAAAMNAMERIVPSLLSAARG